MGEVAVHLDDEVGAVRQRPAKSIDVGPSQATRPRAMEHVQPTRPLGGQLVGDATGAVGRLVIHDQDVQARKAQIEQGLRHGHHVLGLVVGGQDNSQFQRRLTRRKTPARRRDWGTALPAGA